MRSLAKRHVGWISMTLGLVANCFAKNKQDCEKKTVTKEVRNIMFDIVNEI